MAAIRNNKVKVGNMKAKDNLDFFFYKNILHKKMF